jgi:hypothetical protein
MPFAIRSTPKTKNGTGITAVLCTAANGRDVVGELHGLLLPRQESASVFG